MILMIGERDQKLYAQSSQNLLKSMLGIGKYERSSLKNMTWKEYLAINVQKNWQVLSSLLMINLCEVPASCTFLGELDIGSFRPLEVFSIKFEEETSLVLSGMMSTQSM